MRTWRMEKTAGWGKQQGEETAAKIRQLRKKHRSRTG